MLGAKVTRVPMNACTLLSLCATPMRYVCDSGTNNSSCLHDLHVETQSNHSTSTGYVIDSDHQDMPAGLVTPYQSVTIAFWSDILPCYLDRWCLQRPA